MPCSASTAAGDADAAPPVSAADKVRTPTSPCSGTWVIALADRLIKPLVIKGTFERRQLVAEFFGMGSGSTRIKGFAVAPCLDQSEVVGMAVPLQHIVVQIAVVFAGGISLHLNERSSLV